MILTSDIFIMKLNDLIIKFQSKIDGSMIEFFMTKGFNVIN